MWLTVVLLVDSSASVPFFPQGRFWRRKFHKKIPEKQKHCWTHQLKPGALYKKTSTYKTNVAPMIVEISLVHHFRFSGSIPIKNACCKSAFLSVKKSRETVSTFGPQGTFQSDHRKACILGSRKWVCLLPLGPGLYKYIYIYIYISIYIYTYVYVKHTSVYILHDSLLYYNLHIMTYIKQ